MDVCAGKQRIIERQIKALKESRRRIRKSDDIDIAVSNLNRLKNTIRKGPPSLDAFRDEVFESLIERIIVDSQTAVRFVCWGGVEIPETLRRITR